MFKEGSRRDTPSTNPPPHLHHGGDILPKYQAVKLVRPGHTIHRGPTECIITTQRCKSIVFVLQCAPHKCPSFPVCHNFVSNNVDMARFRGLNTENNISMAAVSDPPGNSFQSTCVLLLTIRQCRLYGNMSAVTP